VDVTRLLLRSDLRQRWRSWLAVVVLAGVVGGVSMAAFSGWIRTATAMDRFLDHHRPPNAYAEGLLTADELEGIDGVEVADGGDYFLLVPVDRAGKPQPEHLGQVSPFSHTGAEMFRTVARSILVEGELADPEVASEVVVDEEMADLYDLDAGDTLAMQGYGMDQVEELFDQLGSLVPTGTVFELTVTGILRAPQDVVPRQDVPDVVYLGSAEVHLGSAFDRAHRRIDVPSLGALFGDLGPVGNEGFEMRLDHRATTNEAFEAAVRAIDPDADLDFSGSDAQRAAVEAERSIQLQSGLVLGFGALVVLGGLVLLVQALRRQLEADRTAQRTLAALGAGSRTAVGLAAAKGAVVTLASAVVAVGVATALSPFTPVGHARRAEIDPGVDINGRVLSLGLILMALVLLAVPVVTARRDATAVRRAGASRPSRGGVADGAARAGLSPQVVAGIRAASLGAGRGTVMVTVFVAAAGIVGALGFAASEQRLATDRTLWGWDFDVAVGDGNVPDVAERAASTLAGNPMVRAYSLRYELESTLVDGADGSAELDLSALEDVEGRTAVRMLEGVAPTADDEIALGAATARRLGAGVGDHVEVTGERGAVPFTVSGLVVMHLGFSAERIGEGALMAPAGMERVTDELQPSFALVTFADGVDFEVGYQALRADWGNTVLRPTRAIDVEQLHVVRFLPVWFSGLIAVVAAATLAFVLVLTVRRRRHDLALLRTLGFERRQVRTTVLVQSLALVVPGILAGVVVGVAAGRVAWTLTARSLGAPEVQVAPVPAIAAVLVGALVLSWGVAAVPGRLAARARPAAVLRTE